ncbi:MAG: TatD family hydrolase [Dehalococcoidia bacterium]
MLRLIDTHAHLDEMENLDDVISNAKASGVEAIIAVGTKAESNAKIIDISHNYPGFVYPAIGLHPWELGDLEPSQIDNTLDYIERNIENIVAIGEVGLDYDKRVIKRASKEHQKDILKSILEVSARHNKPVSLHSRYSWKDCFNMVESAGVEKVVFHWFTGFSSVLRDIINAGYLISCTPAVEYHEEHRRAIKEVSPDKLMLETDSPVTYGRENKFRAQPADAMRSLKAAAVLKDMSEEQLARQTTENAIKFFNLGLP